ncbi:mitochondrial glyco protein [Jaminaea rosea]|uniref:Mitochondrial glyco protein n=1 Tax=Jaminaea rosea TaxID=1569628 RepID=A0A316UGG3_9BASI|nr:mitochondrial glyco protein [Jaminaea rosea]PWN24417.1 mitochondrial glyco protein [Jaminaea rosea]
MASLIRAHATSAARRAVAAPTLARNLAQRSVLTAAKSRAIAPRPFSTTPTRLGSGTTDAELSSRLAQELSYEQENSASQGAEEPDWLRDFKSTNTWTIQDVRGSDEICLEREFGNEKIRVLFSIGDIDAQVEEDGMDDAEEGGSSGREDNGESDGEGEGNEPALPVRCAITITKPSPLGALTIDAQAESGTFTIENISFYQDSKLATELTAEADWKRRGLYIGPQFPTLDDALQEHFQGYLEERGIDDDLALFVPLFAEWKEQKEYCTWLDSVKKWVDA